MQPLLCVLAHALLPLGLVAAAIRAGSPKPAALEQALAAAPAAEQAANQTRVSTLASPSLLARQAVNLTNASRLGPSLLARQAVNQTPEVPEVNRPVSQVIELLTDIKAQLEEDSETDEATYNKMHCFCQQNDAEKTQAITDAEARISALSTSIQQLTGSVATLTTETANEEEELRNNEESVRRANEEAQQVSNTLSEAEKEMLVSITSLQAAITVLSKHHADQEESFMQRPVGPLPPEVAKRVGAVMSQSTLTPAQREHLAAFLHLGGQRKASGVAASNGTASLRQTPPTQAHAYSPASGEILGMLKQLLADFQRDLSGNQRQALELEQSNAELLAAKAEEIAAVTAQLDRKRAELAADQEQLAADEREIEDIREALGTDQTFLMDLKARCTATDHEWESRRTMRSKEVAVIAEAIAVLSADDAHDTFARTLNEPVVFLQTSRQVVQDVDRVRAKVSALLSAAASRTGSSKLAALAGRAQSRNPIEELQDAIEGMVEQLEQEKEDEIVRKEYCNDEFSRIEAEIAEEDHLHTQKLALVGDYERQLREIDETTTGLQTEIDGLESALTAAADLREREAAEYEQRLRDEDMAVSLLDQAITVLERVYVDPLAGTGMAELQQRARRLTDRLLAAQTPEIPEGFGDEYQKHEGVPIIIELILVFKGEAEVLRQQSVDSEQAAQVAYVKFQSDTAAAIASRKREKESLEVRKQTLESEKDDASDAATGASNDLAALAEQNTNMHANCDFLVRNFDIRQQARDDEVVALRQAIELFKTIELPDPEAEE